MTSLIWTSMIVAIPIAALFLFIAFDQMAEQQRFENFCETNGFQNNVSKHSGFAASRDYCIDSNGKLIEVICDRENCYFLEDTK